MIAPDLMSPAELYLRDHPQELLYSFRISERVKYIVTARLLAGEIEAVVNGVSGIRMLCEGCQLFEGSAFADRVLGDAETEEFLRMKIINRLETGRYQAGTHH